MTPKPMMKLIAQMYEGKCKADRIDDENNHPR